MSYEEFLRRKTHLASEGGFTPDFMPDALFDFQRDLTEFATQHGRSAMFADCGMGKTAMQLTWAENVARRTDKPVLILTPLAVGAQTVREAEKFGIEATRSKEGEKVPSRIVVTNYQRLHHFDPADFAGVVCDESSILKNFDGQTKAAVTEFMRNTPYRLLATATAAPNDYVELGTSSEALGLMGHMDMLGYFFRNVDNTASHRVNNRQRFGHSEGAEVKKLWRFKYHAEDAFWKWVASWARAVRKPSDIGYSDEGFDLPALIERETVVGCSRPLEGKLFVEAAVGLHEQRQERRATIEPRCEQVAEKVDHGDPALVWCHLNDEGDLLEKLIPGAVQVKGSQSDTEKEARLESFANGDTRVLIIKPQIGAFGLNFQHCAHVTFFPSHSYEQYYQGIRRCWRFGQEREVVVDVVTTEGEINVLRNLQRKAAQADHMFTKLVEHMNDAQTQAVDRTYDKEVEIPSWL